MQAKAMPSGGCLGGGADVCNKVTHQGCSTEHADASLLACDTPSAGEPAIVADLTSQTAPASVGTVQLAALACRRCTQLLLPHVRQGYFRFTRNGIDETGVRLIVPRAGGAV